MDQRQYFNTFSLYQTWDGNKVVEDTPKLMNAPPVLPKKERVAPPSVKPFLLFLVVVVLASFFRAE